jgi:hypothetical protein
MKRLSVFALALLSALSLSGCEKMFNQMERDGSLIGSTAGDWVVVKYSGGRITDVWKLHNVMVQSEMHSDGWLFKDASGNMVNIGGDVKATRVTSDRSLFNRYVEYHMEFDLMPYEEKLRSNNDKPGPATTTRY